MNITYIYQDISLSSYQLYDIVLSQTAAALTQLQTSVVWFREKKLASYATLHLSGASRSFLCMQSQKGRNRMKGHKEEQENTGGYAEVKAIAFIDCDSSGQLITEVECAGSHASTQRS